MMLADVVLGCSLGGLAALVHLISTWRRATLATQGRAALALVTLPFAIAAPAACLVAGLALWPAVAWAPLLGFWTFRAWALARWGRT